MTDLIPIVERVTEVHLDDDIHPSWETRPDGRPVLVIRGGGEAAHIVFHNPEQQRRLITEALHPTGGAWPELLPNAPGRLPEFPPRATWPTCDCVWCAPKQVTT